MSRRKAETDTTTEAAPKKPKRSAKGEATASSANADTAGEVPTDERGENEPPKPPPVKIEPYTTNLRVKLMPEQIADYADRAATLLAERDQKEDDQKARAKQAKSEIDSVEAELRRVSNIVRTKAIYDDIQCERRFLYETKKVQEWRLDTGDMISERDMNAHETQIGLGFDDKRTAATSPGDGGQDLDDEFNGDEAAE